MNKYFIIDTIPEPVYPQTQCITLDEARKIETHRFTYNPPTLKYRLEPGASFTDVLSDAGIIAAGLLINNKVKEILLCNNLAEHRYYPIQMENSPLSYYWIHFAEEISNVDWIDYENSQFTYEEFGFHAGSIEANSWEFLKSKERELGDMVTLIIEHAVLNNKFDLNLDMFIIPYFSTKVFVSENLKLQFEASEISGITFESANITLQL